jgi:hypothetical protein
MPKEEKFKRRSETGSSKPYERPQPKKAEDILTERLSRMDLDKTSQDQYKPTELQEISVTSIKKEHIDQSIDNLLQEKRNLDDEMVFKTNPKQMIELSRVTNKCDDALKKINAFSNELEKMGANPQRVQSHWDRLQRTDNRYLSQEIVRIKKSVIEENLNEGLNKMQLGGVMEKSGIQL